MNSFIIRSISPSDRIWVKQALINLWGSEQMVYSGKAFDAATFPGFLAEERTGEVVRSKEDGRIVGLLTYVIASDSVAISEITSISTKQKPRNDGSLYCQIISLNVLTPGKGIGTALIKEVEKTAREEGCSRLTVITTNDNLKALAFYQKRGFTLKTLYPNAIEKSRKVKPEIPLIGEDGIPLRDEIELQKAI